MTEPLRYASRSGRLLMLTAVIGCGLGFTASTVVNPALPAMGRSLGADFGGLQWVVVAYLLPLAALLLPGGALSDRFGTGRTFTAGLVLVALGSAACSLAPSLGVVLAGRVVQGVGAAVAVPTSLAMVDRSFSAEDRPKAVGTWAALAGFSAAMGPFIGGGLADSLSWRWAFAWIVPIAVAGVVLARRVPSHGGTARLDPVGAVAIAAALAGVIVTALEGTRQGWGEPIVVAAAVVGVAGAATFAWSELRGRHPMIPLELFSSRQFTGANLVTLLVWAAMPGSFFLVTLQLQQTTGYSALAAGAALLPGNVIMLVGGPRAARAAAAGNPRRLVLGGCVIASAGLVALGTIGPGSTYLTGVLPPLLVASLGMTLLLAPLTGLVLAAVDETRAGLASGVNNALGRTGQLLASTLLPVAAGITSSGSGGGGAGSVAAGYRTAMSIAAVVGLLAAVVAWRTIAGRRAGTGPGIPVAARVHVEAPCVPCPEKQAAA